MGDSPKKTYLPWGRPVVVGDGWLLADSDERLVDLSDTLLLPTQQAGRRLREALATAMAKRGGGLFHPGWLPRLSCSRAMKRMTQSPKRWPASGTVSVLRARRWGGTRRFPRLPSVVDFNWCRQMAFAARLRGTLVDADSTAPLLRIRACRKMARWALAKLESFYRARWPKWACVTHDAKCEAAAKPVLPDGIRRIVLLNTDLSPLVQTALGQAAGQGVGVELVVFGPTGEALFDDWGRPAPEHWAKRELPLANDRLHPSLDERSQARDVANWLKR